MKEQLRSRKLNCIIVTLVILLGVSAVMLAGVVIYGIYSSDKSIFSIAPNNIITDQSAHINTESGDTSFTYLPAASSRVNTEAITEKNAASLIRTVSSPAAAAVGSVARNMQTACLLGGNPAARIRPLAVIVDQDRAGDTTLALYRNQPEDSAPFQVNNMFPGDEETQSYFLQVSYRGIVTVRFHADIHSGSEKLAEVLKCRVTLRTTGETLYDGLMRDMPEAIEYRLSRSNGKTVELIYDITAYLDTSVGNDYMAKKLVADFRWWVEGSKPPVTGTTASKPVTSASTSEKPVTSPTTEPTSSSETEPTQPEQTTASMGTSESTVPDESSETTRSDGGGGELIDPPKTGDNSFLLLWVLLAVASLLVVVLLLTKRQKKEEKGDKDEGK